MWTWKLKESLASLGSSCLVSREVKGGFRQFKTRKEIPQCDNHLYEVILPSRPCRLFFDIECSQIPEDLSATGPEIVAELVLQVTRLMGPCKYRVLDSSGPYKLSYHVIFPDLRKDCTETLPS